MANLNPDSSAITPPRPPAASPSAPTVDRAASPAPPPQNPYDLSTDPILQQIRLYNAAAIAQAQATARAQQAQSLIAYGDPTLARAILADENVAKAAEQNPNSTLAQLAAKNKDSVRGINEATNKTNTFYGSEAARELGLQQQAYLSAQSQAYGAEQNALGQINANVLAAQQTAQDREITAEQDAYNRAINLAQQGYNPGGDTTDQTSTTTKQPAAKPAPVAQSLPYAVAVTANKTGASATKKQGVFAIH